ncbi:MAG TPA: HAD family hydrolase [Verrucomicrobiae bacterium]|nr:HAD family hydrolase [Verrucomicrobiae bacterium]
MLDEGELKSEGLMPPPNEIIAVVFDFDDTLVPDSTTLFLASRNIDTTDFWQTQAKALIDEGFEPTLAYLQLMLERVGTEKALGCLKRSDLHKFGGTLDDKFYQGLPQMFKDLRNVVRKLKNIEIEFYIISSGLLDIIRGSKIVRDNFKAVYACEFQENGVGHLARIKRCISFTEKTRYLFEINKGLPIDGTHRNPHLVNRDIPEANRRVHFCNLIYVGDGLTDIPCFSLVKKSGGTTFGVFHPESEQSAKRALLEFLRTDRVVSCHAPKYRKSDELGSLLRTAVIQICQTIDLKRQGALGS